MKREEKSMNSDDLINLLSALLDHIAAEETDGYTNKGLSERERLLGEGYRTLGQLYERKT